ncbi:hypothetical protein ACIOYT_32335 [Streptomyces halstedii]|uniref:hypothetical protein n=1 Tax=Streptomyces halstedii TaxID=1944 RepID=UPI0037F1F0AF
MSVGFRPTPEDTEIIRAHQRPDESTSDVLRRALRALDRERWDQEAHADMERIATAGENLADEPDEWGYDETGTAVDLRGTERSSRAATSAGSAIDEMRRFQTRPMESMGISPLWESSHALTALAKDWQFSAILQQIAAKPDLVIRDMERNAISLFEAKGLNSCTLRTPEYSNDLFSAAMSAARSPAEGGFTVRQGSADRHPTKWKLAHLRAAARRRVGKR